MDSWSEVFKSLPKRISKLSVIKKVILGLVLLLTLLGIFWVYINVQHGSYYKANQKTVNDVLQYVSQEEYEKAYALFADRYKNEEDFETFKKSLQNFKPAYEDFEADSFESKKRTRYLLPIYPALLEYRGQITYQNGDTAPITAVFIWENNVWKLYILEFNSPNNRLEKLIQESEVTNYEKAS